MNFLLDKIAVSVGKGNTLDSILKSYSIFKITEITAGSLLSWIMECLDQYVTSPEFWENILVKSSKYFIIGNLQALHLRIRVL